MKEKSFFTKKNGGSRNNLKIVSIDQTKQQEEIKTIRVQHSPNLNTAALKYMKNANRLQSGSRTNPSR